MIPVEKNKEYVACIDSVSSDGNGVAHIDGFAVFVLHTVRRWRLQNRRINVVSLCANIIKGVAVAKFVI